MPESAQREQKLADIKRRFEDSVRPRFAAAVQQERTAVLRDIVAAFGRLNLLQSLAQDYARIRAKGTVKAWHDGVGATNDAYALGVDGADELDPAALLQTPTLGDEDGSGSGNGGGGSSAGASSTSGLAFDEFLRRWLLRLQQLVQTEQRRGGAKLFQQPATVLACIVQAAVEPVQKHLRQRLTKRLPMHTAVKTFQVAARFVDSMADLIDDDGE